MEMSENEAIEAARENIATAIAYIQKHVNDNQSRRNILKKLVSSKQDCRDYFNGMRD